MTWIRMSTAKFVSTMTSATYMTRVWVSGKSRPVTEAMRSLPMPGIPKTCSTMMEPEKISPIIMPMSGITETMAFFSAKGKSGKSTLIANLALALARRSGEPVGIIDADLQFGDMTVFFSLEPSMTIYEAVRDIKYLSPVTLKPYFTPVNENVQVLCGTRTPNLIDRISIEGFESLMEMAQSLFRYVLIDIPPGFNPTSIAAVEKAKSTYVVTMLNGAYEMQHAQRALEVMNSLDHHEERIHTIFTRVQSTDIATKHELEAELGYPVDAMIPNEYMTVAKAANDGRMAVDIEPDSPLTRSVNKLAEAIMGKKHIRWAKP